MKYFKAIERFVFISALCLLPLFIFGAPGITCVSPYPGAIFHPGDPVTISWAATNQSQISEIEITGLPSSKKVSLKGGLNSYTFIAPCINTPGEVFYPKITATYSFKLTVSCETSFVLDCRFNCSAEPCSLQVKQGYSVCLPAPCEAPCSYTTEYTMPDGNVVTIGSGQQLCWEVPINFPIGIYDNIAVKTISQCGINERTCTLEVLQNDDNPIGTFSVLPGVAHCNENITAHILWTTNVTKIELYVDETLVHTCSPPANGVDCSYTVNTAGSTTCGDQSPHTINAKIYESNGDVTTIEAKSTFNNPIISAISRIKNTKKYRISGCNFVPGSLVVVNGGGFFSINFKGVNEIVFKGKKLVGGDIVSVINPDGGCSNEVPW